MVLFYPLLSPPPSGEETSAPPKLAGVGWVTSIQRFSGAQQPDTTRIYITPGQADLEQAVQTLEYKSFGKLLSTFL